MAKEVDNESIVLVPGALDPPAAFAIERTIESWQAPDLSEVCSYDYSLMDNVHASYLSVLTSASV